MITKEEVKDDIRSYWVSAINYISAFVGSWEEFEEDKKRVDKDLFMAICLETQMETLEWCYNKLEDFEDIQKTRIW